MKYIAVAFGTLRTNALRATLTIAIIAFGIMALVGMVTALNSIQKSLRSNLAEPALSRFLRKGRTTATAGAEKVIRSLSASTSGRFPFSKKLTSTPPAFQLTMSYPVQPA